MKTSENDILVVSSATKIGGGELSLTQVLHELTILGWEATLFFPKENSALRKIFEAEHIPYFPLTWRQQALQACRSIVQREKLLYANGYIAAKHLLFIDPFHRSPRVVHLRESFFDPFSSIKARKILEQMDLLIAISSSVKAEVCQRAMVPGDKVVVVSNGVPGPEYVNRKEEIAAELRIKLHIKNDAPVITMVGRTDPLKGHETFLKSMHAIHNSNPHAHFVIVGLDPPETSTHASKLHDLIKRSPVHNNIHLFPFVENARWFMAGSNLLVVPSYSEGFGRVAIEAMMEGTPVIASRVGGLAEIFTDRKEGIYVEPGDFEDLAQACILLLGDSTIRSSISSFGQNRSLRDYTIQQTADRISSLLTNVFLNWNSQPR